MGFVRAKAFHDLQLGGEFAGLEIRVKARTGHTMNEVFKLDPLPTLAEPFGVLPLFIANVDRWNLEHADGSAVPLTFDAFFDHDMELIRAVLAAYVTTLDLPYPIEQDPPAEEETHPGLDRPGHVPTPRAATLDHPPAAPAPEPVEPDMDIPDPPGPDLEHLRRLVVEEPVPA
jgi:hypothetical protein